MRVKGGQILCHHNKDDHRIVKFGGKIDVITLNKY